MGFYFDGYCKKIYALYQYTQLPTVYERKACLLVYLLTNSAFSKIAAILR